MTSIPTLPTSSIATAILFGTISFTYSTLCAKCWLAGDTRVIKSTMMSSRAKALDVNSFESIFQLLHQLTIFGLILLFAYVCEYHPPFPHGEKSYDRDEFFFIILVFGLVSYFTVQKNEKCEKKTSTQINLFKESSSNKACNDVLNRYQTEEWKGWMQFIFLLYHYYHAEEVYNSIRIMITCYVWMTGFGNFSFFYLKNDYSAVRVLQMLWRLNFLVTFLCLSQGTTYLLYYICPLHTFFFAMVYFTMRLFRGMNYTKYGLRLKLAFVACIIFVVWDLNSGLFQILHWPFLGTEPSIGAKNGSMWEWYFRSTLDHWSTFLGILFAANHPITSLFFRKLELSRRYVEISAKCFVGIGLLFAFWLWVTGPFMQPKNIYNQTNSYFGFIPLLTYIYFRNLTPSLRSYSVGLFCHIGKTSLETYLMQHHIWLTSNAKSLLTLIPGWPKVNMILVSVIYMILSRRLYKLTMFLRGTFLPNGNVKFCVNCMVCIVSTVFMFYAVALSMSAMNLISLFSVSCICILCGFCLYQTILEYTWISYRESAPMFDSGPEFFLDDFLRNQRTIPAVARLQNQAKIESTTSRLTPPVIGTMVLMIFGLFLQGMMKSGAGKISSLSSHCENAVNRGTWFPTAPCNDALKGIAYRDYGVDNMVCNKNYAWGWKVNPSHEHCSFTHRNIISMKNTLKNRKIVFVGDSMVRNIYYASLRSLGLFQHEFYDATKPKHSDASHQITEDNILLQFKWAPLAIDQAQIIQEFNSLESTSPQELPPDLIVIGGGAWDCLHTFATNNDKDISSLKTSLDDLGKKMKNCRDVHDIPIVWVIPTVINTKALKDDKKRQFMKEEDMQEMRILHAFQGIISSSSFVLDGPAFSADRVEESYDGVHYPPVVYDAGAQILANAYDWLILATPSKNTFDYKAMQPQVGSMSNPFLGLMMLCFVFIGLLFFDSFMGFSYLATAVGHGVMPNDLYEEAFISLHQKNGLPDIAIPSTYQDNPQEDTVTLFYNDSIAQEHDENNNNLFAEDATQGVAEGASVVSSRSGNTLSTTGLSKRYFS